MVIALKPSGDDIGYRGEEKPKNVAKKQIINSFKDIVSAKGDFLSLSCYFVMRK